MKSLFVRIFLSFWMAQALFVVLAILVTITSRTPSDITAIEAQQSKFLAEAVAAHAAGGEQGLWRYLRTVHEARGVRLYLFDAQNHDLLGRRPPEPVLDAALGKRHTANTLIGRLSPFPVLREVGTGPDGQRYTLIVELPERHGFFGPHGVPGLGILIAVLSSGLVCYILARSLTAPVVRLRGATQKLASGDLSARAGMPSPHRHDEIAELVRDFDGMAERIQSLVQAQKRLLTDISHELRSPLARLSVALELARQRSGVEAASSLDRIERESSRLNELIQHVLTLSRLDANADPLRQSRIDLTELIGEVARDAAYEAQSRQCGVEVAVIDACEVAGNQTLLHSAIENVVRNAIRYTAEGTAVEIRMETGQAPGGLQAVILVNDCGPGVPEGSLEKLFQPFYRIDDARERGTGGAGLGLAITDRAVRLHGGTVSARNRNGGGLTVEIRLPLDGAPHPAISITEPASVSR
jgi:two-component system, OmpR family, sensor histidine kinase CpxA